MAQIHVQKGRTTKLQVALGYDVSNDELKSQIRAESDPTSLLLGEWDIAFLTDGTDGELILTYDDSESSLVTKTIGYMDMIRISGGEPLSVWDDPLEVLFVDTVTV